MIQKILREVRDNTWAVALVAAISMARLGQGMFSSIPGPTLLFLADNTDSNFATISLIFTGKSGGMLLGSFLFSGIMNRFPTFRPLLSLSIGFLLSAVVSFAIPFCYELWQLVITFVLAGASLGYFECGLQSVYLRLWGEEGSRPYIQSFHFGYSIGAFLAPILSQPFLKMASENPDDESECPNTESTNRNESTTMLYQSSTITSTTNADNIFDGMHPVAWPYIIMGIYITITSVILFILAVCKVEKRLEVEHSETYETRPEEPLSKVGLLLVLIILFFAFLVASENCFQSYIYAVTICSDLQFTVTQGALINMIFWAGFGIGRGLGIIFAKFFSPTKILFVDFVGSTLSLIIISIWGENNAYVTWVITFVYGFFIATAYSTGVSWASRVTNVTGSYMVIFSIGIGIGGMGLMPIGGLIFDNNPFQVLYYSLGLAILNVLAWIGMEFISYRRRKNATVSTISEKEIQYENGKENGAFQVGSTEAKL